MDSYLRWRGIEATLELSRSNNAKVVIIGGGKDGVPIILGNTDATATPPRVAAAPPEAGAKAHALPDPTRGPTHRRRYKRRTRKTETARPHA